MTLATFQDWKKRKAEKKQKELEEKMKEESKKTGKSGSSVLSGRMLFKFDPTLFQDDEAAVEGDLYEERNDDDDEEVKKPLDEIGEAAEDSDEEAKQAEDGVENGGSTKAGTTQEHANVDHDLF